MDLRGILFIFVSFVLNVIFKVSKILKKVIFFEGYLIMCKIVKFFIEGNVFFLEIKWKMFFIIMSF